MADVQNILTVVPVKKVKKAYRLLALKHHPDKGGDPETFKRCDPDVISVLLAVISQHLVPFRSALPVSRGRCAEAYAVLSDVHRRCAYDTTGDAALADIDLEEMMSEVFADGGWFEQMIGSDDVLGEMLDGGEASVESMQASFASFMAVAMGGGGDGTVLMPDGSRCKPPRMRMPSLADLMSDTEDPEERMLMEKVARKMGVGERGALVPGTSLTCTMCVID